MIWANLLAIPILLLLSILQIGIVSRLPLLQGTADLLLLAIIAWTLQRPVRNGWFWALVASGLTAFTSAISPIVPIISYGVTLGLVQFFKRQVWQAPLLIMLFLTLIGTFLYHSLTIAQLLLSGTSVPILDSLSIITLPSILLNLALAIPVYAIMRDLANWIYPLELES